jgi:Brp/Blh family beta-carotene 15,15'-monooxygenase
MSGPTTATAAADRFEALAFRIVPLVAFAALAIASLATGPAWSAAAAPWPWLVSLVIVGLPHGAADLAVTRRLCGRTAAVVGPCSGYVALMLLAGGAFALAPVPALLAFVALSGWHFGAAHADAQTPSPARRPGTLALAAVARGAPVLGIPLVAHPEAAAAVGAAVAGLAGAAPAFAPDVVRGAGVAVVSLGAAALAAEAWRTRGDPGGPRRTRATLVDLAAIGLLEATTDPLFSVGCYFLGWHAWRQMRLLAPALGCGPITGPRSLVAALVRIHAAALPLLVPTWAALAAAWWWLPFVEPARGPRGLAILSLVVYVVVTPSHDLLMDWWRGSDPRRGRAVAPSGSRRTSLAG